MKNSFKTAVCGGLLAISIAIGGVLFPTTALAVNDPYGRGQYFAEYSVANWGYATKHQRKVCDQNGYCFWKTAPTWMANGARSQVNTYGYTASNTEYSALFK